LLSRKVKLVRHQDPKGLVAKLKAHDQIETYQQFQPSLVFHECERIVSFTGERGSASRFIGVYKIDGHVGPELHPPNKGYLDQAMFKDGESRYRYTLSKQARLTRLRAEL
jgi:hypothetical protein